MQNGFFSEHWLDDNDNPAGGVSTGTGFTISWQNGPLGPIGSTKRLKPNGAFVEDVIQAVIDRIEFYEDSRFACSENRGALVALGAALQSLEERTASREARSVEGTHAV